MGLEREALHVDGACRKETAVADVEQSGSKAEAAEIEQRKDDVGGARCIRGMFTDG